MMNPFRIDRVRAAILLVLVGSGLGGCGVAALPFRASGAVVHAVPVVGGVAAAPLDGAAKVID